ncbi:hypothetical protein [Flagellimonas myxillae]|uniref:hypothetical protein n=1 Tax=Flagellimonas myxillae TaxID=2942214 RepID=UPI00201F105B|nr:hypothetical protein [Muricauda myxillae]MCL6265979.1 hypothetical protein [Muricauda myxillae]
MNFARLKIALLFVLVANLGILHSQVLVYNTYQDFLNQTPVQYDGLDNYRAFGEAMSLKVIKNGETERIRCKDFWGFVYKDALFRVDHNSPGSMIARLMSDGKLYYYENGIPHIDMLLKDSDSASYLASMGYTAYISTELDSEMIPLTSGTNLIDRKRAKKKRKRFRKENTEHEELFNCIRNTAIETLRRCISKYNADDSQ